jgi:hypothetical protein
MAEKAEKPEKSYGFRVLGVDGTVTEGTVTMSDPPAYAELKRVVEQHISGDMEHVYVWNDRAPNARGDMFCDEVGQLKGLPRNEAATAMYRRAWVQATGDDPETLPWIAGPAVVFDEVVWT